MAFIAIQSSFVRKNESKTLTSLQDERSMPSEPKSQLMILHLEIVMF